MSPITKIEIYAEKDQDLTNEIYQTHIKEDAAALRPKMTPVIRYLENGGQEDLGPGASVDFEAAKAGEEVRLSNPRPRNDANKSKAEVLPAGDPTRRKTVKGVVGNDQA